ncbi:peptidoglycan D,D-transpeptidase FtsI family protein [Paenibacillus sp. 481]|uniref:peptidoglycan D,D-transpeptidase FtsI family protein n=1 Tax=Paenibacillus sp. 481 TaxID=2835869 RepID=UPI001E4CC196|nr:penicillin-binding transpeptidase domain-containing protein [Paenibacillus sp. 481]
MSRPIHIRSRIAAAALFITFILICYTMRLGWLQFIQPHRSVQTYRAVNAHEHTEREYSNKHPADEYTLLQQSIIQRERAIVLEDGRGSIVDRKGRPIRGEKRYGLVLFPVHPSVMTSAVTQQLAAALNVQQSELIQKWSSATVPLLWPSAEDKKLPYLLPADQAQYMIRAKWDGVRILPLQLAYPLGQQTPHWVGYVSAVRPQDVVIERGANTSKHGVQSVQGAAGLERSFEPLLRGLGETTFVHYTDVAHRPLHGLDVRLRRPDNPNYPLKVVTTTDIQLQRDVEEAVDRVGLKKGAIVVLDASTRDVVAMVSRPSYNPNHVEPQRTDWNNQALKAIVPGSVFKLVIAAAALESGVTSIDESFHCNGKYGKYGLLCWKSDGHGRLSLREAFAKSCNVTFAALGERLDASTIQAYAHRLGVGDTVGMISDDGVGHTQLKHFDGEERGRVFVPEHKSEPKSKSNPKSKSESESQSSAEILHVDGGVKAQVGIGQRDVRVTPLAAANLVATLLNDGYGGHPRLVREVQYAQGRPFAQFAPQARIVRVIQPRTAHTLLQWMADTVQHGTGTALTSARWPLAGKSGTAQAESHGTSKVHTWFVGYGPTHLQGVSANKVPRYAVSVVAMDEPGSHSHRATALFRAVMDVLAQHHNADNEQQPHK